MLIKFWLEVSNKEQERRFKARIEDPLRQWKLSNMDLPSRAKWYEYSRARDAMLKATDTHARALAHRPVRRQETRASQHDRAPAEDRFRTRRSNAPKVKLPDRSRRSMPTTTRRRSRGASSSPRSIDAALPWGMVADSGVAWSRAGGGAARVCSCGPRAAAGRRPARPPSSPRSLRVRPRRSGSSIDR